MSFSRVFSAKFEHAVARVIEEIGPRPSTGPNQSYLKEAVIVTQCDEQEAIIPDTTRGTAEFGIHCDALPADAALPMVMAIASYVAVFSYVSEYVLMDINFPITFLSNGKFPGPKFGPQMVPSDNLVRLGVVLKPRFNADIELLRDFVRKASRGKIDYLIDDELSVQNNIVSFEKRVSTIMRELRMIEDETGVRPAFIANVTGDVRAAMALAEKAMDSGVDGVMVNIFSMGFDVLMELANDQSYRPGVVANGLGLGVLTRGPQFRVSTELLVKFARLSGADAVYTGPMVGLIDSQDHSSTHFFRALTEGFGPGCDRKASAAVMSGGLGLPEILKNSSEYTGPMFLSMGYQFAEYLLAGFDSELLMECIREVWQGMQEGGIDGGRQSVERMAKRGKRYRECLKSIRAEEAVSHDLQ